jgi:hypothetical protein
MKQKLDVIDVICAEIGDGQYVQQTRDGWSGGSLSLQ